MNDKDRELYRIIDIVIECCTTRLGNENVSVTKEDIFGKCKRENANITRCMIAYHLCVFGLTHATIAMLLDRTEQSIRNLIEEHYDLNKTNRAYNIANSQVERMINESNSKAI